MRPLGDRRRVGPRQLPRPGLNSHKEPHLPTRLVVLGACIASAVLSGFRATTPGENRPFSMRTLGEIQPGMTLGRYEFLVPIAEGGMAAVWAARLKGSRGFSKTVAVKTMLPTVSDDPQFEQMFLDEAQLASSIRHPNVCQILDLGEQDDVLYQVMEYVDGEPLSAIRRAAAKQGGIPRPIGVKIVADACAGLHAAHELKDESGQHIGLVHRDISPQNILITFDGQIKIVDFGVAKASGRTTSETSSGQIKGKPPYMSPEQALGEPIDRRTDIFAAGIILYQLTTGKHPFRGESDIVTLQNIVSDRPIIPPRAYDKEYPKGLEEVVLKALERDRDKRFSNAADFEAALDDVFPPGTPRVRSDEVGKLVTGLLGERGDERRVSLKEAIRLADERGAGVTELSSLKPLKDTDSDRLSVPDLSGLMPPPSASNPLERPPSADTEAEETPALGTPRQSVPNPLGGDPAAPLFGPDVDVAYRTTEYSSPSTPGTPIGTELPTVSKPSRSGWVAALLGIVAGVVVIGGALWFVRARAQAETTQAPATEPAAATEPAPEAPPDDTTAAPAGPDAAPSPDSGAVAVDDLAMEPDRAKPGRAGRQASVSKKKPAATAEKPVEVEPPKPTSTKPIKKKGSGFVPPPVTDPGF